MDTYGRGVTEDRERGFSLTKKAYGLGHVQACDVLGSNVIHGHGCDKDVSEAIKIWEKNCKEREYPQSCFRLGSLYLAHFKNHGMGRDPERAKEAMEQGCRMGHPTACHTLATMYNLGDGVARDEEMYEKYSKMTNMLARQAQVRIQASSGR